MVSSTPSASFSAAASAERRPSPAISTADRYSERSPAANTSGSRAASSCRTTSDRSFSAAYAQFAQAYTLVDLGRLAEAEAGYTAGATRYLDDPVPGVRLQGARSAVNLGVLLRDGGRHEEAARWFERVLRACAGQDDPGLRRQEDAARRGLERTKVALGQVPATVLRPWPLRVWLAPAGLAGLVLLSLYLFGLFALVMGVSKVGVDGVVAAVLSPEGGPIAFTVALLLATSLVLRIALLLRRRIEIGRDNLVSRGC